MNKNCDYIYILYIMKLQNGGRKTKQRRTSAKRIKMSKTKRRVNRRKFTKKRKHGKGGEFTLSGLFSRKPQSQYEPKYVIKSSLSPASDEDVKYKEAINVIRSQIKLLHDIMTHTHRGDIATLCNAYPDEMNEVEQLYNNRVAQIVDAAEAEKYQKINDLAMPVIQKLVCAFYSFADDYVKQQRGVNIFHILVRGSIDHISVGLKSAIIHGFSQMQNGFSGDKMGYDTIHTKDKQLLIDVIALLPVFLVKPTNLPPEQDVGIDESRLDNAKANPLAVRLQKNPKIQEMLNTPARLITQANGTIYREQSPIELSGILEDNNTNIDKRVFFIKCIQENPESKKSI